ncbi:unnamed protein product, partial [Staurois parvus]
MGGRTVSKQNISPPCQLMQCFEWLCSAEPCKTTQHIVKHTQNTVNPWIALDVNPFLPSAIGTVSVHFISTDHCIGVTGDVSDTKSVPPRVRMSAAVPQSRYKSL